MKEKLSSIFKWGVVDVSYIVCPTDPSTGKQVVCSYYRKWYDMIRRSRCPSHLSKYPSYNGVEIIEDWKYLSNFIKWVDSQPNRDWRKCHLDKDLLGNGKLYGPETCVFITKQINHFIKDRPNNRGGLMVGVSRTVNMKDKLYRATISQRTDTGRQNNNIGYYKTEIEAHKAWQAKKHEYACQLADLQDDPRVADALRQRYAPDKDWTKA